MKNWKKKRHVTTSVISTTLGDQKMSFWLKFAIEEALSLLSAYVESTKLTAEQKALVEKFIADGQAVLQAL